MRIYTRGTFGRSVYLARSLVNVFVVCTTELQTIRSVGVLKVNRRGKKNCCVYDAEGSVESTETVLRNVSLTKHASF